MRWARGGVALAALLLAAGPAQAQKGEADKKPGAAGEKPSMASEGSKIKPVAERKLGSVKRPTVKKRGDKEAKKERKKRVTWAIPENLRAALEAKIDKRITRNIKQAKKLRKEAIKLLRAFIKETPDSAQALPEALMRLGELEWEQARDQFLVDFNKWESKPADLRGDPPEPSYSQARSRFARVLKNHKTFRQYDLALYVDGFLASESGKHEEALDRFNKILKWFPKSRFVPDAHMVRAEYEFTKDFPNYETAYKEYEKVLKYKNSGLYDLALFKSAWCLWRLGRTDEAAKRFLAVFKATEEGAGGRSQEELDELQREALKNLVAVFVEDEKNTADDMYSFLKKAGGEKFAGRIVLALAEAFYDQAHYERGVEAYKLLLRLEPTSKDAYKYGLLIAEGYSTMEDWKGLETHYKKLVKDYTKPVAEKGKKPPADPPWTKVQSPLVIGDAERAIEKQLRQDAIGLHAKAQADKNSRMQFEMAARLYEVYLSRFGKKTAAYQIYFNQAEIYFYRLDDGGKAADSYMAAVRMKPKGKLSRDALYNAIAALERQRYNEFESARQLGKKQRETSTDKKLTEALELYVATYPKDKDLPELLFRQGKLYYDYEVYDPAVRLWGLLLEKYPNSRFAVGAGELILDSFNKSEDYDNIETWARRLKKAPSFQKPDQQERLNTLIVQAVFKQGEQLSAAGSHDKAASAYLRAAKEFPTDKRAAKAAVNAEVEARKAADLTTLAAAVTLLIDKHKNEPEAAQGLWIAATTYQSVGLFSEAAGYHELIVQGHPKYEHHKDAAYNAVLLRTTVGEHAKAIESGERYKKHYPRGDDTDEVIFLMGKAHEKAEKWNDAQRLYQRYSVAARNPSRKVEALVRLATVRVKLKNESGAKRSLADARNTYKRNKRGMDADGKYFAAKAIYMEGERILADYDKVKIEGDVKRLKQRLREKSKLLKKAADKFLSTAEIGVAEWTTASLYQVGYIYESFAKALYSSPPPDTLNDAQKEQYSMQIDEFVIPIEERAIEAYESGWLKAVKLGIFNSWTAKMREALGRLLTEVYPPLHEVGFKLRDKGPTALPALIDGPRREKDGRSTKYLIAVPKNGDEKEEAGAAKDAKKEPDADAKKKGGDAKGGKK